MPEPMKLDEPDPRDSLPLLALITVVVYLPLNVA